jgi:hypothetical protein
VHFAPFLNSKVNWWRGIKPSWRAIMNKILKTGIGISIIIALVVLTYVGMIFGSLFFMGIVETAQDSMNWEYYGDDVKSEYMYKLELQVFSTPDIRTTIDNVTIYIPVLSGKDNLKVSESFIADVKQGNIYTGK